MQREKIKNAAELLEDYLERRKKEEKQQENKGKRENRDCSERAIKGKQKKKTERTEMKEKE